MMASIKYYSGETVQICVDCGKIMKMKHQVKFCKGCNETLCDECHEVFEGNCFFCEYPEQIGELEQEDFEDLISDEDKERKINTW